MGRLWIDVLENCSINVAVDNEVQSKRVLSGALRGPHWQGSQQGARPADQICQPDPPRPEGSPGRGIGTASKPPKDRALDRGPPHANERRRVAGRHLYLWSHDQGFLQSKLNVMVRSLGERNLKVNATKTKYVPMGEGQHTVKVGEMEVWGKERNRDSPRRTCCTDGRGRTDIGRGGQKGTRGLRHAQKIPHWGREC